MKLFESSTQFWIKKILHCLNILGNLIQLKCHIIYISTKKKIRYSLQQEIKHPIVTKQTMWANIEQGRREKLRENHVTFILISDFCRMTDRPT